MMKFSSDKPLLSIIKSNLYQHLILNGVESLSYTELLACIIAEAIKDCDKKHSEWNKDTFLKKFLRIRITKKYLDYTRESCIQLIQENLMKISEDRIQYLLRHVLFIKEFKDGRAYFNLDYKVSKTPQLRQYGNKVYVKKILQKD